MKRVFDEAFKANALSLVDDGLSIAEVCKRLSITPKQLRHWRIGRKANLLDVAEKRVIKLEKQIEVLNKEIVLLKARIKRQAQ